MKHVEKIFGWILILAILLAIIPIERNAVDIYKILCAKKIGEQFALYTINYGFSVSSMDKLANDLKPYGFTSEVDVENKNFSYTEKEILSLLDNVAVVKVGADSFVSITLTNGDITFRVCGTQIYTRK